ncbi:MAG: chemotaxis protein CheC [Pseudomonadota bacterium]
MVPELTEIQTDALMEMINIGMGKAARVLSEMVQAQVSLQVPAVQVLTPAQASQELLRMDQGRVSAVVLGYKGLLSGNSLLCFPPASAAKLANILIGDEDSGLGLDALKMATLTEVGNIMLNGVVGSVSNLLDTYLQFMVPFYEEGPAHQLLGSHLSNKAEVVVIAETSLDIKALQIRG